MGNTGFDVPFHIRRKRNLYAVPFLMYLDGRDSAVSSWVDKEETAINPSVTGAQLAPLGYFPDGDDYLSGNLGVNGDTIIAFTIGVVLVRNEVSNNEGILYGLFGSTHYPRMYFTGTTLTIEVKLDGNVKTINVANSDTYIKKGHPHFIVVRGSVSTGIEVLIDGVSRGTQTDTGSVFSVGSGDFKISKDAGNNYMQTGNIRFLVVCDQRLNDTALATWRTMLIYEGLLDLWRDDFAKWSGNVTCETGSAVLIGSPYSVTLVES